MHRYDMEHQLRRQLTKPLLTLMDESLIQLCRVQDDGPTGCKLLLYRKKHPDVSGLAGTVRIRIG